MKESRKSRIARLASRPVLVCKMFETCHCICAHKTPHRPELSGKVYCRLNPCPLKSRPLGDATCSPASIERKRNA